MRRDFPDELLSAFLDDELTPAERALVEQHLANNEADRQLLAELKSLRSDLAVLPQVNVDPKFADRVVQAALSAAATPSQERVTARDVSQPGKFGPARRWSVGVVISVAAVAAAMLAFFRPWNGGPAMPPAGEVAARGTLPVGEPTLPPPASAAYEAVLRQVAQANGDAVVVRLSVEKGTSVDAALDAALAKAGIIAAPAANDAASLSAALVRAYRSAVREALVDKGRPAVAPAGAVLVEAPYDHIENAFAALATAVHQPLRLAPAARLTFSGGPGGDAAEGEPGSVTNRAVPSPAGGPSARHLPVALFPLPSGPLSPAANTPPGGGAGFDPRRPVRMLILVEHR